MRIRLAAALIALPLLAFDCGGEEQVEASPFGMPCRLQIRGAAAGTNEDLWCVVAAFDYADITPPSTMWAFELVAYRGMTVVGGGLGLFHEGRPALGTPYGWNGSTSSVESGEATRWAGDPAASTYVETHRAEAPLLGQGTGALSVTFSRIPPPGATGPQLVDVHGTLSGTLPALEPGGLPVTFAATF